MNDPGRTASEAEAPVNPYSLLEAVNRSSSAANTAWLIYIGLMAYLLVAVAGISHKDLLLNNDIPLPVLQVKIELTRFFLFAPIVLVLVHTGVLGQLVLLARKALEFHASICMLETTDERTHPLRLELDNFFFVQAIAGPERSRVVSAFLHGMSWLTLVILPVLLLLYIQVVFLPYHDTAITWAHRVSLLADIALLMLIGVFLMRSETSFLLAFWRTSLQHPVSLLVTAALLGVVALFSLFAATVPGEPLDRLASSWSRDAQPTEEGERQAGGYALPFMPASTDGSLFGMFHRNLNVTDLDLVVDKDVVPGEPSLNLRGRDLRFAKLDRTDLHQADLTGAALDGASLAGADLRNAWMQCADLNRLLLADDRRAARCTSARGTNFVRARLSEAKMVGIDLRGAKLDEATLTGAELTYGLMSGASFANARLERADLSGGAWLQGANFLLAALQGADLSGAKLQMTDFSSAGLQGANLYLAHLEGAVLRNADLEGANLQSSKLHGADLSGAKLQAADLSEAEVWRTTPPASESALLTDMSRLAIKPLEELETAGLKAVLARLDDQDLKARLLERLTPLLDEAQAATWASPDQQTWSSLAKASEGAGDGYKTRLTEYLAGLMCKPRWANGSVATGIARRAQGMGFKGDVAGLYDRLKGADCPPGRAVPAAVMSGLGAAADAARGQ
jgi:uncharacterized protein YjbI with pentapeptide repeats